MLNLSSKSSDTMELMAGQGYHQNVASMAVNAAVSVQGTSLSSILPVPPMLASPSPSTILSQHSNQSSHSTRNYYLPQFMREEDFLRSMSLDHGVGQDAGLDVCDEEDGESSTVIEQYRYSAAFLPQPLADNESDMRMAEVIPWAIC
jgi:hypothetical protein